MARRIKTLIGWEEWCALPDLHLPAIKAKVDTGAKTSALHAFDIVPLSENGEDFVEFSIHPIQRNNLLYRRCRAPLVDRRAVTSSNGERENRFVILTRVVFPDITIHAELTLTSRHNMAFRMLLGREALRQAKFRVDPSKSCLLGRNKSAAKLYGTTLYEQHQITEDDLCE